MDYLFMGYTVIWGLIAAYVFILGNRQKQLRKEMKHLEEWNSQQ